MESELELALELAEKEFLRASVAVWRQIEAIEASEGEYTGLAQSTELRQVERAAWNRYRDALAAAGR